MNCDIKFVYDLLILVLIECHCIAKLIKLSSFYMNIAILIFYDLSESVVDHKSVYFIFIIFSKVLSNHLRSYFISSQTCIVIASFSFHNFCIQIKQQIFVKCKRFDSLFYRICQLKLRQIKLLYWIDRTGYLFTTKIIPKSSHWSIGQ